MEKKYMQLTGLYARLEPVYQEMLTMSQELQALCVKKSLATEDDQKDLARLLIQREKLLGQAAVQQKEAAALAFALKKNLQVKAARAPLKTNAAIWAGYVSAAALRRREALLNRLKLLIREIISLDAVTGQALQGLLQDLGQEIKKVQVEKRASKAYRNQDFQMEGFFVDSNK